MFAVRAVLAYNTVIFFPEKEMAQVTLVETAKGFFKNRNKSGSFFFFNSLYRWLNWILAVVLLVVGATPEQAVALTAFIYVFVFAYNMIFTLWPAYIEDVIRKYPALIFGDVIVCTLLLLAYGWRSPFSVYGFSPVVLAGTIFSVRASFIAAALAATGYGISVSLAGHTWQEIVDMGQIDAHLFEYFDYFLVATFIAYPAALFERLKQSNTELLRAQAEIEQLTLEKERRRLAGDIHDSAIQSLHSANMVLAGAIKGEEEPGLSRRLGLAKEAVEQALTEIGTAIDDLFEDRLAARPICEVLRELTDDFEKKYAVSAGFTLMGRTPDLDENVKKALFLIAQEALSNAAKHSGAENIALCIEFKKDGVKLKISDDGRGFDAKLAKGEGHGLETMVKRADDLGGSCQIDARPGRGVEVVVAIPLPVARAG